MPKVKIVKTAEALTQRDWLDYLRASRDHDKPAEDAPALEWALYTVQVAADAGWLECDGLNPTDIIDWPLSVDVMALAREVNRVYAEATQPDPKAF